MFVDENYVGLDTLTCHAPPSFFFLFLFCFVVYFQWWHCTCPAVDEELKLHALVSDVLSSTFYEGIYACEFHSSSDNSSLERNGSWLSILSFNHFHATHFGASLNQSIVVLCARFP